MGCDIHFYVEKYSTVAERWFSCDEWVVGESSFEPNRYEVPWNKKFYHYRNYKLFSILADVRNGYGFAGVDTGDKLRPIAKPRGLPDDCDPRIADEAAYWGVDGHSHSYLTISEIIDYDWTQTVKVRGWISEEDFRDWDLWGRDQGELPRSYSGGVGGKNVKHISIEEMERRIEKFPSGSSDDDFNYYCQFEVDQPYYQLCSDFLGRTVWRMLRFAKPWALEYVRCVFWFDN